MKSIRAPWKCRALETVENQRQVSHCFHSAWKSLARFPHSHRAGWAWKSAKPRAGFALSHLLSCIFSIAYGLRPMRSCNPDRPASGYKSVTYVAGLKCYLSSRPYTVDFVHRLVSAGSLYSEPRDPIAGRRANINTHLKYGRQDYPELSDCRNTGSRRHGNRLQSAGC